MLDVLLFRNNLEQTVERLRRKGFIFDVELFSSLESDRKFLQSKVEGIRSNKNRIAKEIGVAKSRNEEVSSLLQEDKIYSTDQFGLESQLNAVQQQLQAYLATVPNILQEEVPDGKSSDENKLVRSVGVPKDFGFTALDHVALTKSYGIDMKSGADLSGSRFAVLRGDIARLHRALAQFMLDTHVDVHGYTEVSVPAIVNAECMYNTGQLSKFADESFATDHNERNMYLIPTSEVPVTNLFADKILQAKELPVRLVCHSPCFRKEAGSYGRDTHGLIRMHQFDKVELVNISHPSKSNELLEEMLGHAENILKLLDIPYRIMLLCSGDVGFASSKTYDIEVWIPSGQEYREISSCSNMTDFQARRMGARFKDSINGGNQLVHTLNGSGLAVGRCLVAVLENYQNADGSVTIPGVLQRYLGKDKIAFS
jgi:seryl-tRNA synthetase